MHSRDETVALAVAAFVFVTFVVVLWLDTLVLWLVWGVVSVAIAGVTLVRYNWGFDPPDVE